MLNVKIDGTKVLRLPKQIRLIIICIRLTFVCKRLLSDNVCSETVMSVLKFMGFHPYSQQQCMPLPSKKGTFLLLQA